ncbi:MAG: alanine--glyoxylate aminotransferase family protein [Chloroflexi bacterium]|nr:alanine--glyoxylate aminotransferase family protein [Chloroflexota bacterium]
MNLRIPGPVPLPEKISAALQKPMIDHRGPEFAAIQARVVAALQRVFQTQNDMILFTSSGTGALEAAIVNTISPGDRVLSFSAGLFGDRFADIATTYGAEITRVDFEWGRAMEPERIARAVRENRNARVVLVTHNETSTGVLHPLKEIAQAVRENSDAVLIVDAISSVGGTELQTEAWGLDMVITASQKAWACPPGLAMLSVSPRAWQVNDSAKTPRYYFDLRRMKNVMDKGATPFTPAMLNYFALDNSLELIEAEGIEKVWARHAHIASYTRGRAEKIGLKLFADARYASPTVTALAMPNGIDAEELRRIACEEFGLVIGAGLDKLRGKIIRVGHLGWVSAEQIDNAMRALQESLEKLRES